MNKRAEMDGLTVFIVIVVLVIGVYGGIHTAPLGYICDVGIDGAFCVIWHASEFQQAMDMMKEIEAEIYGGG